MEKVKMSELLEEVADELNISFEDARDIIKNTFFPIVLKHLANNKEVSLTPIGVIYPARARRPKEDGTYRVVPKLRQSPVAKRVLSKEKEISYM